MDEIWLESPSPALRFWGGGDGVSFRPNSAAAAWGRRLKLGDAAWQAIAAELSACCLDRGHGQGRLSSAAADWRSLPMSGGWLVWLSTEKQYADHESVWGTLTDKLELIQEFGRLGLFERDLKTDVGRWDAHMFRLFEFEPADGTPTFEQTCSRVHPEDVAKFRSWHECLRDQAGRHSLSFRLVLPEGVQRDLHAHIEIRVDATGRPDVLLGVAFDETKSASRVRAEQAVSRHLSTALRLARISVWHIDLQQQWISLNDVGFEMAGLELQAGGVPIGTVRRLAHPDDVLRLERAGAQAFASQAVVDLEARYLNPDGSGYRRLLTRRVAERDASGAPVGLLGVSLEQTDRIVERERAQALAQRIEIVTNTAGVGVYSVDLRTGEIEWNRQMFSIHGLPEDARAPSFDTMAREIVHPDDRAQFVRSRLQYDEIEGACESEVRIVHPDGAVRSVEFRSRRDRVGDRWFVLGIAIDVTERVMQRAIAERSLREKEAAEHASAAKSEFLARMSHELRTPLNAVLGFAQLIEHEAHAAPFGVQLERVARIRQAGERLLTLVGDVLERVNQEELTDSVSPDAGMRDAATAQVTQPDNGAARLSVLYIEDNPVNVILVEELVAMRANTTLNCAADGLTGVACAAASRPDVVLVDMQLPDIDGFEVLRRLRELRGLEGSAIIALSANGISEDIALARAAGFDDYWTKPIDFQHFLRGLDHLAALRC